MSFDSEKEVWCDHSFTVVVAREGNKAVLRKIKKQEIFMSPRRSYEIRFAKALLGYKTLVAAGFDILSLLFSTS